MSYLPQNATKCIDAWIFIAFFMPTLVFSQNLGRYLISSAGGVHGDESFYISWAIGEPAIKSIYFNDGILTEGFHQSEIDIQPWHQDDGHMYVINGGLVKTFPNPATTSIWIESDTKDERLHVRLYNLQGGEILLRDFAGNTQIDVSTLPGSVYILDVMTENRLHRDTYKIIIQ